MATQPNQIAYGTQSPVSAGDTNYWQVGDIVINNNPAGTLLAGQNVFGWSCVASGSPGTWGPLFTNPTNILSTTATSGTLTNGYRAYLLNPATTGTYSLPDSLQNAVGAFVTFKNLASGSVTLTPLGSNNYADAAAITLTQYQSVTLFSNNTSTWYKQA